jgi:hypothetical protein
LRVHWPHIPSVCGWTARFRIPVPGVASAVFFFLVSRSDIALDSYAGSSKPLARLAQETHSGSHFVQRHQGHLVIAPQSPECRRRQTTTTIVAVNGQVVDVHPIVERINSVPRMLAIGLNVGVILGTGKSEQPRQDSSRSVTR